MLSTADLQRERRTHMGSHEEEEKIRLQENQEKIFKKFQPSEKKLDATSELFECKQNEGA